MEVVLRLYGGCTEVVWRLYREVVNNKVVTTWLPPCHMHAGTVGYTLHMNIHRMSINAYNSGIHYKIASDS